MAKGPRLSYNSCSLLLILFYAVSQAVRWNFFPQHFDIWYHLLTAWGFIRAGGYTTWDFWQYAPAGRPHIYPPLFHTVLALLMKAGIDKIFLARLFSVTLPVIFLLTLWNFIRRDFSARLAFLCLITMASSFSFHESLINHMPSTIALIFGFLAFGQAFKKRILSAGILLALCFYTHMGTSWFFALAFLFYALFNAGDRRPALISLVSALALSLPIIIQQLTHIKLISIANFNEQYFCEFKTLDYILAAFGIVLAWKKGKRYTFFAALFIASFIYAKYPSRFFSAEGYLPVALLSAVSIDGLCENFIKGSRIKILTASIILFVVIFSPTVVISQGADEVSFYKIHLFDSAFMNIVSGAERKDAASKSILDSACNSASKIITDNSSADDIIYCTEETIGLRLAALSGRATANHLLPEVCPPGSPDAMASSRIIVMLKYHSPEWVKNKVDRYGLKLIGRNNILDVYVNPAAKDRIRVRR